ncbi:MAG: RsmE family RNA methyltransferase [Planctomycetota bacterium]
MRIRRFQVDDVSGSIVRVGGPQAEHALKVLRLKVGGEVALFDGRGAEVTGRVRSIVHRTFEVEVTHRYGMHRDSGPCLVMAAACPKGNRADWLVEKCAELGVRALWLLKTERGSVDPGEGKLTRWCRKGVEAAKQSGHTITMAVEPARTVAEALAAAARAPALHLFYGDPRDADRTFTHSLAKLPPPGTHPSRLAVFIGPEGGFTNAECGLLTGAGARPVRLSNAILRVETAAVAAAAAWASWVASTPERPVEE